MATIPQALRRIKGNLQQFLPTAVIQSAVESLHRPVRHRVLPPDVTTYLFAQQLLHGNTAIGELRHLSGLDFTDAAYCQARSRLPVHFFRQVQQAVLGRCPASSRWRGHRLFFLDGSSFSMPDTDELREMFGQPGSQADGCGFPSAHLLVMFDYPTGYLLHALPGPHRTHDMANATAMHRPLRPGDVLIGDRAFASFAHLAVARQRKLHGLFRAHQKQLIDFRPHRRYARPGQTGAAVKGLPRSRWVKRLGKHDQLVEYFKPKQKPTWMSRAEFDALPDTLLVRELRIRVKVPGSRSTSITLVTTLTNAKQYTARALAKLYRRRWEAEVNLRHLKQTLKLDVLRSKTFPGVMKELLLIVTLYNLVRQITHEAARRQQVPVSRISFVDALRWLRWREPGAELPDLKVNPDRPDRVEPRVVKRRPKPFKLLTKPRSVLRKALLKQAPAP